MKIQEFKTLVRSLASNIHSRKFSASMEFAGQKQARFINTIVVMLQGNLSAFDFALYESSQKIHLNSYLTELVTNPFLPIRWHRDDDFDDIPDNVIEESIILDMLNRGFWALAHEIDTQKAKSLTRHINFDLTPI